MKDSRPYFAIVAEADHSDDPFNTIQSYHTWLIRQRVYCARDLCYSRAVTVRNFQGEDICLMPRTRQPFRRGSHFT